MEEKNQIPQKENVLDAINNIRGEIQNKTEVRANQISNMPNHSEYEQTMSKETDPDLMTSYELIDLPSKGFYYKNKISKVEVEYMTSKDEDLLTTPSLIESGEVLNKLLSRKIKTKGINVNELLTGDRNAILLFLRTSSYGSNYSVLVTDPRTGKEFKTDVNLTELKYKELKKMPDENGHFNVELPMRKKIVKFRLLNAHEEKNIFEKAQQIKEAYNEEFSQYNTMKLKANIVSIDGNENRSYIDRFVDAMPALDALTIRREIQDVSPDVDMAYEFTASDGYKFKANLTIGLDFFFPSI
jgi:hypothetical protein